MRNIIRLKDYTKDDIKEIFKIADDLQEEKYKNFLDGKIIAMFFPNTSIRTRVTFERGIYLLGGQSIIFLPETLNKKEKIEDVAGYLNNWIDAAVIRYNDILLLDELAKYANFSIIRY